MILGLWMLAAVRAKFLGIFMWYYIENDQQRGPVMEADLETLRREGKIEAETLVWREGMTSWQPWREVRPATAQACPSAAPPQLTSAPAGTSVICSQCGGSFPASEVIRYGNAAVCASCKPVFIQKLKEGANVLGVMEYAPFLTRFAAYFVDGIITGIIGGILGAVIGGVFGAAGGLASGHRGGFLVLQLVSAAVGMAVRAAYFIYFIGKDGQTPGKKLCKIRVVNADGSPVSYAKATGRFFGYMLSALILGIGFLMAAWDPEKRALHDRLCDTRVVKV
jgi:uncharacterized RDD family membrane protein YckC